MENIEIEEYKMIISNLENEKKELINELANEKKENERLQNQINIFRKLVVAKDSILIQYSEK